MEREESARTGVATWVVEAVVAAVLLVSASS